MSALHTSHRQPQEVYQNPDAHWSFITAANDNTFEGQYFDRKEAGRLKPNSTALSKNDFLEIRKEIAESISAFANSNRIGGLLVIGVSTSGEVLGINHLTEDQKMNLTKLSDILVHHHADVKFHHCTDKFNSPNMICLIYVHYAKLALCETVGADPKSWVREGYKNTVCDAIKREQIRREKKIVDFENTYCCPYVLDEVSQEVLGEFRKRFLSDSLRPLSDEELLYQIGALDKVDGQLSFNHAGYLFFATNPQRRLSYAYIRLLRFGSVLRQDGQRPIHDLERKFSGPLPLQIRAILSFFRDSGFFKTYQHRKPEGGFAEEPELPPNALNEAVVNAVVHRDYAINLPIECEHYRNAFLVRNPGRLQQRDNDVPSTFNLEDVRLIHKPQNPKILEWLKVMGDKDGAPLIKAINEGTWQMQSRMVELGLPSPVYNISPSQTQVILISNAPEREEKFERELSGAHKSSYFANLFPLTFVSENIDPRPHQIDILRKAFTTALKNALVSKDWFIDTDKYSRLVAHQRGNNISLPPRVGKVLGFYPSYVFHIREYWGNFYLCIDYKLEVKNLCNVRQLLGDIKSTELVGLTATARISSWKRGKIISVDKEFTRIQLFDYDAEELVSSDLVIPQLPSRILERVIAKADKGFDLARAKKEHGLSLHPSASRIRAEKTKIISEYLAENIFPISFGNQIVHLTAEPVPLLTRHPNSNALQVYSLPEPTVEFSRRNEAVDIKEGITKFGSYQSEPRNIEIVPICTTAMRDSMATLLDIIKVGKYQYKGAERTFGTRLFHNSIITVPSVEDVYPECERLLRDHPDWSGNAELNRIFLVQTPDTGIYGADDEKAPYYRLKRLLLENGIPCQMLKGKTIRNSEWKDLNLVLNIVAKCAVTPWVLPDAIPDADFFIGLSYTENLRRDSRRLMGYANVFNQYGRWQFYSADSETFPYSQKEERFKKLVRATLERLELSNNPSIYFHYSAKFSRDDRNAILEAARSVRPQGTYNFVWINTDHDVRVYDSRAETDGSLSRGSYVTTSRKQILLSTTGNNPYRKGLGTPIMLEVNAYIDPPVGSPIPAPDLKSLAIQMLNLTKLNWASVNAFSGEPITTYYAHQIAYLTAAFLRQSPNFKLHPVLERTPWFI